MALATFMAGSMGRGIRVVAGIVLILIGVLALDGAVAYVVEAVGLVAVLAGVFNVCLLAPILGAPFKGKDIA